MGELRAAVLSKVLQELQEGAEAYLRAQLQERHLGGTVQREVQGVHRETVLRIPSRARLQRPGELREQ